MTENNTRGEMDVSDQMLGLNFEDLDLDQMDLVYLYVRKKDREIQVLEDQTLTDRERLQEQLKEKDRQESDVSNLEESIRKTQQEIIRQMNAREGARGAKLLLENKAREMEDEIAVCSTETEERQRNMEIKLAHWKERFEKFQEHLKTFEDYRLYTNFISEAEDVAAKNVELQRKINQLEDFVPKMEEYKVSGVAITDNDKNFFAEYVAKWIEEPDKSSVKAGGEDIDESEKLQATGVSVINKKTGIDPSSPVVLEIDNQIGKISVTRTELIVVTEEKIPLIADSSTRKEVTGVETDVPTIPAVVEEQDRICVLERFEVQSNFSTEDEEDTEKNIIINTDDSVLPVSTANTAGDNPNECSGIIAPQPESLNLVEKPQTPNDSLVHCREDVRSVSEEIDRSAFFTEADKQNVAVPGEMEVGASTSLNKVPSLPQADISSVLNTTAEGTTGTSGKHELPKHSQAHRFFDFSLFKKKSAALPPFRFPSLASASANTTATVSTTPTRAGTVPCAEIPTTVESEPAKSEQVQTNQEYKSTVHIPEIAPPASIDSSRLSSFSFRLGTTKPSPKIQHVPTKTIPGLSVNTPTGTATSTSAHNLNESLDKIFSTSGTDSTDKLTSSKDKMSFPLQFKVPKPPIPKIPSKPLTSTTFPSTPPTSVPTSPGVPTCKANTKSPFLLSFSLNIPKRQTPKMPSSMSSTGTTSPNPSVPTSASTSASTTAVNTPTTTVHKLSLNFQPNIPKPQTPKIPTKPMTLTTSSTPKLAFADNLKIAKSNSSLTPQLRNLQSNFITQSPTIHHPVGVCIPSVSTNTTQTPSPVPKVPVVNEPAETEPYVFKTPQVLASRACPTPVLSTVVNPAPKIPAFSFSPPAGSPEKKTDDKETGDFFAVFGNLGSDTERANGEGVSQPASPNSSTGMPRSYLDFGTMGQFATENSDTQEFSINDFFNMTSKSPNPDVNNDFHLSFQGDSQPSAAPFKLL